MNLHKASLANKTAKMIASPLSRIVCMPGLLNPARTLDAYFNFLMGKGSGTGWGLDQEIAAAVSLIQRDTPVIFDVGANVGSWSKLMRDSLPDSWIFMFEPSSPCQKIIQELSLANASLIPKAAGEVSGEAVLHFSSETDGGASLHDRGDSYFRGLNYLDSKVEVTTIDAVMEIEKIDFVDFIKMDIEGHELFALKGAKNALDNKQIGAISFEFGSGNINSRTFFRDFWDLLTVAGFEISRVIPSGKLVPIHSYYEDLEYFRGVSNYFAKLKNSHPIGRHN